MSSFVKYNADVVRPLNAGLDIHECQHDAGRANVKNEYEHLFGVVQ